MRLNNAFKTGGLFLAIWICSGFAGLKGQERITVVPYPQELQPGKGFYTPSGAELSLRISGMEGDKLGIITTQLKEAYQLRREI